MSTWKHTMQSRLGVTADGIFGPKTYEKFFRYMGAKDAMAKALAPHTAAAVSKFNLDANPLRFYNFFGEMAHESMNFNRLVENLNYTTAQGIVNAFGRINTTVVANRYIRKPQALANYAYAGKNGNDPDPTVGDGWRYRGRALIQLTGKKNYVLSQVGTGLQLVANPDLASTPEHAMMVSAEWWDRHGLSELADQNFDTQISGVINRGNRYKKAHGLDQRRLRKAKITKLWK